MHCSKTLWSSNALQYKLGLLPKTMLWSSGNPQTHLASDVLFGTAQLFATGAIAMMLNHRRVTPV
jgi:hypothetical protein